MPVQMKGSYRKSNTYPIRKNDLEHYLKEKGVLLVVVNAIDTEKQAIKYATLTSLDLARYLQKASNKNKIGIELTDVPDNINDFLNILLNFIETFEYDYKKDALSIQDLKKNYSNVFDKLQFTVKATSTEGLKNYLTNQPIVITAINSLDGYQIIVDKFKVKEINISETKIFNEKIFINGKQYYDHFKISRYIDYSILDIGNSLHIHFGLPEDNKINVNINYELTGNLPECIHDTEFIVEMYKNKGFTIDEHDFTFMKKLETTLCEEQIKSLTFNLKKLNEIKELFDKLNIRKTIDYYALSKEQKKVLQKLIDGYLYKKEMHIDSSESILLQIFNLGKIHIFMEFCKKSDSSYIMNDFFKTKYQTYCNRCNDSVTFSGSQFFILDSSDFSCCDNINYSAISASIRELPIDDNVLSASYIYLSKMLIGYDKQEEKNNSILDAVTEICNHYSDKEVDETASDLFILKKIECQTRIRKLNESEKETVLTILDRTQNNLVKLICHILLDNFNMVEHVYNKLDDEQKEIFLGNSIKALLKDFDCKEEIKSITEQSFNHLH